MLNSSYDGEIEQWDMIDKYSMNVIYTASVDIRHRMSAKKRSFDFVEFDTDLVGEQDIYQVNMLFLITADIVAMLRMNGCMKLCYVLMIN